MVFVDTNVLLAALNEHDSDHKKGKALLESAFQRFAWLYTSDYILDECFSIAWSKTRKLPLSFRLSLWFPCPFSVSEYAESRRRS